MNLLKFLSLLEKQALFFARVSRLGDPFEGSTTQLSLDQRVERTVDLVGGGREQITEMFRSVQEFEANLPEWVLVNCWHINDFESAAMWKLYVDADEGVAVRSTVGRLCDSFRAFEHPVHIGTVAYLDYEVEEIPDDFWTRRYLHKRKVFEHERELRAVIMDEQDPEMLVAGESASNHGFYVDVKIPELIERVHVSPYAPGYMRDLLCSIRDLYGFGFSVDRSTLLAQPVF